MPDTRLVSRRQAIGFGVGAGVVATAAGAATFAFASGRHETMTVWQLATDWDTPRGPNRKRRLESTASRNAAIYRYALYETDALDMNLHVGSWAPAVAVLVDKSIFEDLWRRLSYDWTNPWNGRVVRLFDARHEAGTDLAPVPTPTAEPTPEPTDEASTEPTPEPTPGPRRRRGVRNPDPSSGCRRDAVGNDPAALLSARARHPVRRLGHRPRHRGFDRQRFDPTIADR